MKKNIKIMLKAFLTFSLFFIGLNSINAATYSKGYFNDGLVCYKCEDGTYSRYATGSCYDVVSEADCDSLASAGKVESKTAYYSSYPIKLFSCDYACTNYQLPCYGKEVMTCNGLFKSDGEVAVYCDLKSNDGTLITSNIYAGSVVGFANANYFSTDSSSTQIGAYKCKTSIDVSYDEKSVLAGGGYYWELDYTVPVLMSTYCFYDTVNKIYSWETVTGTMEESDPKAQMQLQKDVTSEEDCLALNNGEEEHSNYSSNYVNRVDNSSDVSCGNVLNNIPEKLPAISNLAFNFIKILTPIFLIIKSMIDLFKGVASQKEDEIRRAKSKLFKRLIPAALVFFVMAFAQFVISFAGSKTEDKGITGCLDCFVNNSCSKNYE